MALSLLAGSVSAQTVAGAAAAANSAGAVPIVPVQTALPSVFSLTPSLTPMVQTLPTVQALPTLALPKIQALAAPVAAKSVPALAVQKAAAAVQAPEAKPAPAQESALSALTEVDRTLNDGKQEPAQTLRKAFDSGSPKIRAEEALPQAEFGVQRPTQSRLKPAAAIKKDVKPLSAEQYRELKELKALLGDGTVGKNGQIQPYGFLGGAAKARAAGLEGFLYTKLELERARGENALAGELEYFFGYLDALTAPAASAQALRGELSKLKAAPMPAQDKNRALNELLVRQVGALRSRLENVDQAAWGRSANIYMILARAYNRMKPGKGFFDSIDASEFERIRQETHANTLWLLDVFDIGVPRRWGTGGGSPYAIAGYHVKKELGGDAAFQEFIRRAHEAGFRVMTDFIPNHQSLDSDLIKDRPEATIHIVPPQNLSDEEILRGIPRESGGQRLPVFYLVETDNYPENGKRVHKKILVHHPRTDYGDVMWIDMAQIDHSRPEALEWQVAQARKLAEKFGVDGVRRDMAYYLTNASFFGRWIGLLEGEAAQAAPWAREQILRYIEGLKARQAAAKGSEFWTKFSEGVKTPDPSFFAMDEVYSHSTDMSRAGSDGLYNKNDHDTSLGQNGLYDAMMSRSAAWIRAALRNVAFRAWQRGGASLLNFIGTHDGGEGNPWDKFGRVARSAIATALIFRPTILYNGVEQGVGQGRNLNADLSKSVDREKAIPFDIPVSLNWNEVDRDNKEFLQRALAAAEKHADLLRKGAVDVLEPAEETALTAYSIGRVDEAGRQTALIVAANFSEGKAWGRFKLGKPVLKAFGAFEPRKGKTYVLRDLADLGPHGQPKTYTKTGQGLLEDGLLLGLDGGKAHIFEVEEIDSVKKAVLQKPAWSGWLERLAAPFR